jgi:hypothetical protein
VPHRRQQDRRREDRRGATHIGRPARGGEANVSRAQDERLASSPTLESALAELDGALTGLADYYQAIAGKSRDRSAAPNEVEQPA